MNNIQQTRVQLEKTYQNMGGQELEEDAASILNGMQTRLNTVLDSLARVFATRYNLNILILIWKPYDSIYFFMFKNFFNYKIVYLL